MDVVITGTNFVNKGSELMVRAILQELGKWPEKPRVALPLHAGSAAERKRIGASHFVLPMFYRYPIVDDIALPLGDLLPPRFVRRWNVVRAADADLVLDAAGFAYSDQWGVSRVRRYGRLYRQLRRRGAQIVLLPQAVGPFGSPKMRAAFLEIARTASLIFLRDADSMRHARSAAPTANHLREAPDFTVLVEPRATRPDFENRACLMPNVRMLDKTTPDVGAWYLRTFEHAVRELRKLDLDPFILLMQQADAVVVERLGDLRKSVQLIWEPDPVELKGIIGSTRLLVGSRYHGLVCALSQGIPAVGVGWSHKYERLFEDYGCGEMTLPHLAPDEDLDQRLNVALDAEANAELVHRLRLSNDRIKGQVREMWAQVRALVASTGA